jgi:hypothetical protein
MPKIQKTASFAPGGNNFPMQLLLAGVAAADFPPQC